MLRIICKRSIDTLRITSNEGISNNVLLGGFKNIPAYFNTFKTQRVLKLSSSAVDNEFSTDQPNVEIVGDNQELQHKFQILVLEAEVWRQEGRPVPNNSSITKDNWQELLKLSSKTARKKYLEFLFKVEKKKENKAKKKEDKRTQWEQQPKPVIEDNVYNYNLGYNNIFLRFYDTTINNMYNNRLVQAMQFGQQLIVDCGYYDNMTSRENVNCAKQLMLLFAENRSHDEPFDLHYCNANPDSSLMKSLHKNIATMYEPWFPLNLHNQSYLDLFPKEKLVYLTPHCRDVLKEFDHDAIYIIGAIVDKVNNDPLSMAKAKKEGIRMAKFPVDHYLDWGAGSGKSLTLNQTAAILLDIKKTNDWKYAFRHVPKRKLADFTQETSLKKFNFALNNFKSTQKSFRRPKVNEDFESSNFKSNSFKPNKTELINIRRILKE